MNIFCSAKKLNKHTLVYAHMVSNVEPTFIKGQINIKFLIASLKTLTNSKNCSESCIKFLQQLSFALIGHSQLSEGKNKLPEEGY